MDKRQQRAEKVGGGGGGGGGNLAAEGYLLQWDATTELYTNII